VRQQGIAEFSISHDQVCIEPAKDPLAALKYGHLRACCAVVRGGAKGCALGSTTWTAAPR